MESRRIMGVQGVGAAIREERLDQGLTQAQLASHASVSREWLSGVERGERAGAELSKILRVLSALDLDMSFSSHPSRNPADEPAEAAPPLPSAGANGSRPLTTNEATREALRTILQPHETTPPPSIDEQTIERGRRIIARIAAAKKAEQ